MLFSVTLAGQCSKPCPYCWTNSEWRPIQDWYSIVTFVLGIILAFICWVGTATLCYLHLKYFEDFSRYNRALSLKTQEKFDESKIHNQTNENIISKLKKPNAIDITNVYDQETIKSTNGATFNGRNQIISVYGIPADQIWSNDLIKNTLK